MCSMAVGCSEQRISIDIANKATIMRNHSCGFFYRHSDEYAEEIGKQLFNVISMKNGKELQDCFSDEVKNNNESVVSADDIFNLIGDDVTYEEYQAGVSAEDSYGKSGSIEAFFYIVTNDEKYTVKYKYNFSTEDESKVGLYSLGISPERERYEKAFLDCNIPGMYICTNENYKEMNELLEKYKSED